MTPHVAIKIPKGLVERIDKFVEEGRYTTRSEFVREAVRRRIDEIKATYPQPDKTT